jgi:quinohemoprotein ethanol dehydrogenase
MFSSSRRVRSLSCVLAACLVACIAVAAGGKHPKLSDGSAAGDWAAFGRTYGEQHFSPLQQVSRETVDRLGLAWSFDLPRGNSVTGALEVDGTLYVAPGYSLVHAIDARTGRLKWRYDPKAAEAAGKRLRQGWGSRGLAWWNGKVYTGTQDGRLIAIDAKSGKPVWSVMTLMDGDLRFISGPPRAFAGKIIIGHGGADASDVRGYVTAYDAETGKRLWRFFTVPGDPAKGFEDAAQEMAAKTWAGEWWKYGGGGTVWNAITYDEEFNQIYLGTGNGAPWNHKIRSQGQGDNLFLSSIVALDADSGAYKWHYQTNPGESWDFNANMDMQLATLDLGGQRRPVLMTAPKNGFLYVLDRRDGSFISAKPYVRVTWAKEIDANGRPVETPGVRYDNGETFAVAPSPMGAHSWLPMAYSPDTRLVYIPAIDLWTEFHDRGIVREGWRRAPDNLLDVGAAAAFPLDAKGESALVAWDPVTQTQRWRVPTPGYWNGGVLATAGGLVFQGHIDGTFNAYDAATGERVWSFDAKAPVLAPPITYTVGKRQYVTVLTGMGTSGGYLGPLLERFNLNPATQARRVLTFALDARTPLPPDGRRPVEILPDPAYRADADAEQRGLILYAQRCGICHGFRAVAVGAATDLRGSGLPREPAAFDLVVRQGALVAGGMPRFDELTDRELEDIRQYLRFEAVAAAGRPAVPKQD